MLCRVLGVSLLYLCGHEYNSFMAKHSFEECLVCGIGWWVNTSGLLWPSSVTQFSTSVTIYKLMAFWHIRQAPDYCMGLHVTVWSSPMSEAMQVTLHTSLATREAVADQKEEVPLPPPRTVRQTRHCTST
jgi:hypothetical protein